MIIMICTICDKCGHKNPYDSDFCERCGNKFASSRRRPPEQAIAAFLVGCNAFDEGDFDLAIICFSDAIKLDPRGYEHYINRGSAYAENGEYPKAIQDYYKAIEINPNNADVWYGLGLIYQDIGNYRQAQKCFDKVRELE